MTTEELDRKVSSIICNYNHDVVEQFNKFVPDIPEGEMVDFGTGQAKSAIMLALLNPSLYITTFTNGDELGGSESLEDYKNVIQSRLVEFGVDSRINFDIGDRKTYSWDREIVALNIDS